MAKFGLGKGLGALIPEHQQYFDSTKRAEEVGPLVTIVPLGNLRPNPDQPRKEFDEYSIAELADSIKRHGLLQPIMVEPAGGDIYVIIAGERRFRAASKAGLAEIPVIVRPVSAERRLELSLIENVQREDLNPMEEAEAYQNLMELSGSTQEQVAEMVGKNRSTVANALRLLRLSEPMRDAVRKGDISAGHARSLLAVADDTARALLFDRILAEGMSVRQVERAVQEAEGRGKGKPSRSRSSSGQEPSGLDPDLAALKESLIERFGTKVEIRGTMDRGTILVEYYSSEDLQRILDASGALASE